MWFWIQFSLKIINIGGKILVKYDFYAKNWSTELNHVWKKIIVHEKL